MGCLAGGEIDVALGAAYTAIQFGYLLQHVEVSDVLLYHGCVYLIQFGAIGRTGDSEDIVHIVFLLTGYLSVLVAGVGGQSTQMGAGHLVVGDELLGTFVGILFVERVRHIHQFHQHLYLALVTQRCHRFLQALVCLVQFGVAEVLYVGQTLLAPDILGRLLRVSLAEILDTLVLHVDSQVSQTLFLCRIGSVLVECFYYLRTLAVDSLVGIRAGGVHSPPGLVSVGEHLVLYRLVEERDIHHTLLGDGRFFFLYHLCLGRSFSLYFLRFFCARQCRNGSGQRQYN